MREPCTDYSYSHKMLKVTSSSETVPRPYVQNFSVTYGKHFRTLTKVCQLVLFAKDLLLFAQLAESFAEVYCSPSNSHGKFGFNIRLRRAWWP